MLRGQEEGETIRGEPRGGSSAERRGLLQLFERGEGGKESALDRKKRERRTLGTALVDERGEPVWGLALVSITCVQRKRARGNIHVNGIEGSTSRLGVELNSPDTLARSLGRLDSLDGGVAGKDGKVRGRTGMVKGNNILGVEEEGLPSLGEGVHQLESVLV